MALNQAQQLELQKILESDTFKAAKEQVLMMSDGDIKNLQASEAAIKMAIEKGVRYAFRLLVNISTPTADHSPLQPRSISRQRTHTQQ